MCPVTNEPKVILNYDSLPGLENRWPTAVIRPLSGSREPDYMADTVCIVQRYGMSTEQVCAMARKAAPLARTVFIDGYTNPSHDRVYERRTAWNQPCM